jgi:ribosomal-protein-alanine N-acetyltransferase
MKMIFVPMNEEYANEIIDWHYDGIYSFYDMTADKEDLEEFKNPDNWDSYFAVLNEEGELVGNYCYWFDNEILNIGFGIKPELTGKGLGQEFVLEGIKFLIDKLDYKEKYIELQVAEFNKRAIKVYERIGFEFVEEFMQKTNGGEYKFIRMRK